MKCVRVNASKKYDVIIGAGVISSAAEKIAEICSPKRVMIVSDDIVFPIYGDSVSDSLKKAGYEVCCFVFPHGEENKSLIVYSELLNELCNRSFGRKDLIIALGGGVVGDLSGFAAATFQRGIDYIQIPTTLLAAVDASVGGKTAVDLNGGKNQAGAFYQPSLVLCDTDTLKTLDASEIKNGFAEIVKYGVIGNEKLLDALEKPDNIDFEEVISECVSLKRDYVEKDEHDTGCRKMLNFGHTIGHAVEYESGYTIPHGYAVAIGMASISRASYGMGFCGAEVPQKITSLLSKLGLPVTADYPAEAVYRHILNDKKTERDNVCIIVPEKIGQCAIKEIPTDSVPEWLRAGGMR